MPVYEFYCGICDTVYNFFSRTVNTEKVPFCPQCKDVKLKRRVSLFNSPSGKSAEAEDGFPDMDESRMMRAISMLEREASHLDEEDPRQAAKLLRKLSEVSGLNLGSGAEEALARMERGDDPEKIEAEMGDLLDDPNLFQSASTGTKARKRKPKVDDKLYDL